MTHGSPIQPGPSASRQRSQRLSDKRLDGQADRSGGGSVRRRSFGLGSLVRHPRRCVRVCLPAGLLVLRALRIHVAARAAGCGKWPNPLPAVGEGISDLALVVPPERHGHRPVHGRRHHPGRIRQRLHLPGLLPGPWRCSSWSSRRRGSGWPGRR